MPRATTLFSVSIPGCILSSVVPVTAAVREAPPSRSVPSIGGVTAFGVEAHVKMLKPAASVSNLPSAADTERT